MKLFNFIKKRNEAETAPIINEEIINPIETEIINPIEMELTQSILDTLSFDDIIYVEMKHNQESLFVFVIINEQFICYKTYSDEVIHIEKILEKGKLKVGFNWFFERMSGIDTFTPINVSLRITKEYFVYKRYNKEYHIYSQVPMYIIGRGIAKGLEFDMKNLGRRRVNAK